MHEIVNEWINGRVPVTSYVKMQKLLIASELLSATQIFL